MPARVQSRILTQSGSEVGEDNVSLEENDPDKNDYTAIISWTCPRKYESIRYDGENHATRGEFRTVEEFEVDEEEETADGEYEFELDADLQPVAGEEAVEDQAIETVEVVNVTQEQQIPADNLEVDYAANSVAVPAEPFDDEDEIKVFPLLTEGNVKFQGRNQFDQVAGTVTKWGVPVYRWADFDQLKQGTQIRMTGRLNWTRNESLELTLDSDHEIVWQDDDYSVATGSAYVSEIEQQVDVEL